MVNCVPQGNQMASTLDILWKHWYKNIPSKLISTHCLSLASLSFLLSLTTTSVYAIAKTLKLHTKCSLWACCCIIMSIVLWSFKLWVKDFDYFLWQNTWHSDKVFGSCQLRSVILENTEITYKFYSLACCCNYHGNQLGSIHPRIYTEFLTIILFVFNVIEVGPTWKFSRKLLHFCTLKALKINFFYPKNSRWLNF